jgi:hypothetical protein
MLMSNFLEDDDPKAVMAGARQEMDRNKHNPNYIGVQFVQIGNSSTTKLKLADLTTGKYGVGPLHCFGY